MTKILIKNIDYEAAANKLLADVKKEKISPEAKNELRKEKKSWSRFMRLLKKKDALIS